MTMNMKILWQRWPDFRAVRKFTEVYCILSRLLIDHNRATLHINNIINALSQIHISYPHIYHHYIISSIFTSLGLNVTASSGQGVCTARLARRLLATLLRGSHLRSQADCTLASMDQQWSASKRLCTYPKKHQQPRWLIMSKGDLLWFCFVWI